MKNKSIILLFLLILDLNFFSSASSDEFSFNISELQISEDGRIIKGVNGGIVTSKNNEIIITANNFKYNKLTTLLEAEGNVELVDNIEGIKIKSNKIFYLKNKEKISTIGKTNITIKDRYNIDGHNLTLLKDNMTLYSNEKTTISDNYLNIYKLDQFQYLIDEEILKGKKIEITTISRQKKRDKYFLETGFINLKDNKFLGKDIHVMFDKSMFGNSENDPRINAVSVSSDDSTKTFEKAIFTTCKKTDKCPPWKITSAKIQHDKEKKQILYKDAWLEIYDFPIIYFPKFFHPDPSVKRQSGLLKPEFGSSKNLGKSLYVPYFHVISKDKDITIKPRLFDDNKILLQSEYRQKTKSSVTIADFSITKGHDSSLLDKGDTRSHFFSNTLINLALDDFTSSTLEVNFEKVSNDNYLKLFKLDSPFILENRDVLESVVKLDLANEDYDLTTSFEMYETLSGSNSDRYQYVLPSYNFSKNFDLEKIKGSFNFNSYGSNNLKNTNITTSTLSNDLNFTSFNFFFDNGFKTNFEILLKNINTTGNNNPKYKNSPQSEFLSAYNYNISLPLKKESKNNLNTLTPKLSFRLSPHDMKDNNSADRRINVDNIFSNNRLALGDSFETGESVTIGIDFINNKLDNKSKIIEIEKYFDLKLATVLRFNEEKNIPTNSTLNKKTSNVFGQMNFQPNEIVSLNYDFSLTDDLNTFEYNSLGAKINYDNFTTQFNYIEERGAIGQTNIIDNSTGYKFNKNNSLLFSTRKNRNLNLTEYYDLVYEYKNDCLIAGIKYKKNYYNDADIKPVEELFFSITVIPLATISPSKMALK
jgi:LPS-assembly protein